MTDTGSKATESHVVKHGVDTLNADEIEQWHDLFAQCFESTREKAASVFRKYQLHGNDAWFCFGYAGDRLVACYSGIERTLDGEKIFVSTDTMSNGGMRNATVKLGTTLYAQLKASGVQAVCGFPNANIVKIRERKLGWTMQGQLHLFVGIPLLWRIRSRLLTDEAPLWKLERPEKGFFGRPLPCVSVLGRHGLHPRGAPSLLVLAAKSTRPGPFFMPLPRKLAGPKQFGYVILAGDNVDIRQKLKNASRHLDFDTIDVP